MTFPDSLRSRRLGRGAPVLVDPYEVKFEKVEIDLYKMLCIMYDFKADDVDI